MEIGKKYRNKNHEIIYTCVAKVGDWAVVTWVFSEQNISAAAVSPGSMIQYEEYIEPPKPIVHTRWVYWWKHNNMWSVTIGSADVFKVGDKSNGYILVQKDEVSHIEYK